MNIKHEIQNILDSNFTRGDNDKALKELLILYNITRKKDIHRAYLDGRLDELDNEKGNMDLALYLDEKAKEYTDNYYADNLINLWKKNY